MRYEEGIPFALVIPTLPRLQSLHHRRRHPQRLAPTLVLRTRDAIATRFCSGDTLMARITACLENGKNRPLGSEGFRAQHSLHSMLTARSEESA